MSEKDELIRTFIGRRFSTWLMGLIMTAVLMGLVIYADLDNLITLFTLLACLSIFLYTLVDMVYRIESILELDEDG